MNKLYNYFKNQYLEDKIVQSYIIGNTLFDDIKEEFQNIMNDFFFENKINIYENPDVTIIKPENNNISKNLIKDLIISLNNTSQFNNKKVYVIDQCEKLNDYSFNSILKILEEPQNNIYAFLITSNMNSVPETILSRCQQIFINSSIDTSSFNNDIIDIGNHLLNILEKKDIKVIGYDYDIYNLINDRETLRETLKYILYKYDYSLKESVLSGKNDNLKLLSKKMIVINNNINRLNYYLNKNLSIDRLIIEIWRCENENSWN